MVVAPEPGNSLVNRFISAIRHDSNTGLSSVVPSNGMLDFQVAGCLLPCSLWNKTGMHCIARAACQTQ